MDKIMDKFHFETFNAIYGMAFVFLAFILYLWGSKKRNQHLKRLIDTPLLNSMIPHSQTDSRRLKSRLILWVFFFSVLALMRPQYDYTWETLERKGIDLFIALDTSKSMLAKDLSPSRFERSILEIKNLMGHLDGDRIGLILFTKTALTQCPLTLDYKTFELFLNDAEIGLLPYGGTSLSAAIEQSQKSFDDKYHKQRILMIVSDGESHDDRLQQTLEKAKADDIKIFSIGVGSKSGVPIIIPSQTGEKKYVKNRRGDIVLTKLTDEALKQAAFQTGGAYIHMKASGFHLAKLYDEKIAPLEGRELESIRKKRFEDRFYFPLFLALLCLFVDSFIQERRKCPKGVQK